MGTIERQYNRDFGVRDDMQLGNFLKREGINSLNDLIQSNQATAGRNEPSATAGDVSVARLPCRS